MARPSAGRPPSPGCGRLEICVNSFESAKNVICKVGVLVAFLTLSSIVWFTGADHSDESLEFDLDQLVNQLPEEERTLPPCPSSGSTSPVDASVMSSSSPSIYTSFLVHQTSRQIHQIPWTSWSCLKIKT
ncbi:unnamed protein product [Cylicocyclus nassatus]|uniref:Uncharacterized protein n=1 Tax=Cylicocyclus nassatus TaxID=53992 RepID=A0AA36DS89_CYLNA|nr:unnamed protein product [Cylicocyclus nassatus]